MVKPIPYRGRRLLIFEHRDSHDSFDYLVNRISAHHTATLETLDALLPRHYESAALVEQPNSDVYRFYNNLRGHFAKGTPIVTVASARWHWTQDDAATFGITGTLLWRPISDTEFIYYLAPSKPRASKPYTWPQREDLPESRRMVSRST